jgi:hypothetical protein
MKRWLVAAALMAGACSSVPAPPAGTDADTVAWWAITGDLSSDAMEGRDTGSAGYDRAADYVEARFRAAGLKPAGENGGYRQTLSLKEVRVEKAGTSVQQLCLICQPSASGDDLVHRQDDPGAGLSFTTSRCGRLCIAATRSWMRSSRVSRLLFGPRGH